MTPHDTLAHTTVRRTDADLWLCELTPIGDGWTITAPTTCPVRLSVATTVTPIRDEDMDERLVA